ncbi:MAG: SpoIIE family protein phosphatase [Oscillospiraceae bacterium]|jgi:stage II sporulation protein E|nr:SpoIIE family protein phosphatase [Oscillospiraceae bacterium]
MAQKSILRRSSRNAVGGALPRNAARNAGLSRWLEPSIKLAVSFALAGAYLLGGLSPFAPAMVAASGAGVSVIASLLGASAGYLMFLPFNAALKYICMCVIIAAAAAVFRDTDILHSSWFLPVITCAAGVFVGVVTYSSGGWTLGEIVSIVFDGVVSGACALFYSIALSPWAGRLNFQRGEQHAHTLSVLILLGTILITLSGIRFLHVLSIGRGLAMLIVFYAAYSGGVGMGCATGVAMGLAMDASSGSTPIFGVAYALGGLVSGLFTRKSRFMFAILFDVVNAAAAVMALGNASVPAILYEAFFASVLFMLTPASVMNHLNALVPEKGRNSGIRRARDYTQGRVEQASIAFRELYETVAYADRVGDEDVSVVFDRAADDACRKCRRAVECWQDDYDTTADTMAAVTPILVTRGAVTLGDMPTGFADSCLSPDAYVAAVNTEARAFLYRRSMRTRLRENREIAYRGYSEMSGILGGVADELGEGLGFEPEIETRMRRWLQGQGATAEVAVFRDRGGRLHAEITGELVDVRRDRELLDKLSASIGVRLCASENRITGGRIELLEAEPLTAEIAVSRMNKSGETISGDRGAYFKTDEGYLYVLLSDGMGSGEAASRASGDAVRVLERFLRSGIAPDTAVRMLNDIMLLRNEDDTMSATVDLAEISLFTGDVTLLKYGSAPTYVKSERGVKRIRSAALAAGLTLSDDHEPDRSRFTMKSGNIAVVVTDGVLQDGGDAELVALLTDFPHDSEPSDLTRRIVERAKERGAEDDVTAIAIRLSVRR